MIRTDRIPSTLDDIRGGVYPADLLDGCASALMLFCAGFYGRNDCVWVAGAGIGDVVAVDTDADKLAVMEDIYPSSWRFATADVYEWLYDAVWFGLRYALVAADPPTSESHRTFARLPDLCEIATRLVILGVMADTLAEHKVTVGWEGPPGWKVTRLLERNGSGAYWAVIQR